MEDDSVADTVDPASYLLSRKTSWGLVIGVWVLALFVLTPGPFIELSRVLAGIRPTDVVIEQNLLGYGFGTALAALFAMVGFPTKNAVSIFGKELDYIFALLTLTFAVGMAVYGYLFLST